jgi:hypothetical protein
MSEGLNLELEEWMALKEFYKSTNGNYWKYKVSLSFIII